MEFVIKKENLLYKLDELWKGCVSVTPQGIAMFSVLKFRDFFCGLVFSY